MYYDTEIVQAMAHALSDGQLGRELCDKILPCDAGRLMWAVTDGDMRAALGMLMARGPGSDAYPELECSAERLRYLCLAASEEMRRAAIELAGSIRHPAAEQAYRHLADRHSGAARAVLCVSSGFKYDPGLRKFENGFEPEPGYRAIENALPEEQQDALLRLAYIAARLPEG